MGENLDLKLRNAAGKMRVFDQGAASRGELCRYSLGAREQAFSARYLGGMGAFGAKQLLGVSPAVVFLTY